MRSTQTLVEIYNTATTRIFFQNLNGAISESENVCLPKVDQKLALVRKNRPLQITALSLTADFGLHWE